MEIRQILKTEFSESFVKGMKDRMVVSFYKYGRIAEAYPDKVDAIASLHQRLNLYFDGNASKGILPGNTEYLMDVANFAMIEFLHPRHPRAYFKGTDADGSPGRIASRTGIADKRDNLDVGRENNLSELARFRQATEDPRP